MILEKLKSAISNEYSIDFISDAILTVATYSGFSVAMWKLPHTKLINLIVSFDDKAEGKPTQSSLPKATGFIVNPFYSDKGGRVFIKDDFRVTIENGNYTFYVDSNVTQEKLSIFIDSLLLLLQSSKKDVMYHTKRLEENSTCDDKQAFISFVKKGIEKINLGDLTKIIAARTSTLDIKQSFSPVGAYQSLCESYPNTFVCLVSHEITGTWLGASPELLFQVDHNNIARTVSLAGTKRKSNSCLNLGNVCSLDNQTDCWSNKEINEQALVTEFIKNIFEQRGVSIHQVSSPKVYSVGSICHLKTDFNINLNIENNSNLDFNALIMDLHPTSAICGMPKRTALDFTREHEGFDRALYGGFLGPINYDNEIDLFVNIRCMQILDNKVIVYAGSGITHNSDPEIEWEETNLKCEMISNTVRGYVQ